MGKTYTEDQFLEALSAMQEEYRLNLSSVALQEASTAAAISLARDDEGWVRAAYLGNDPVSDIDRQNALRFARVFAERDPLCSLICLLWTNFGIGGGLRYDAKESRVKRALDTFWKDPRNTVILSMQGQRELAKSLIVDGELFVVLFPGSPPRIRIIDPLEITHIATDPEDEYEERYYVREWTDRKGGKQSALYPAITNAALDTAWTEDGQVIDSGKTVKWPLSKGLTIHLRFKGLRGRGITGLMASLDWARAHRQFMKGRVAVGQAMAEYIRKVTVKGGPNAVDAMKAQREAAAAAVARRRITGSNADAGKDWIQNGAMDMDPLVPNTGADSAQTDGAMLLQLVGAGVGIYPHYLGAGESFRLATATAMEAPMLRSFEAYQDQFLALWQTVNDFVLRITDRYEDRPYEQYLDSVWPTTPDGALGALELAVKAFPAFSESPDVRKRALTVLDFKESERIVADLEKQEAEKKSEADAKEQAGIEREQAKAEQGAQANKPNAEEAPPKETPAP